MAPPAAVPDKTNAFIQCSIGLVLPIALAGLVTLGGQAAIKRLK